MKRIIGVLILMPAFLLAGCPVDPNTPVDTEVSLTELEGIWLSDGYAELMEITGDTVTFYEVSSVHCLLLEEQPIDEAEEDIPHMLANADLSRISTDPELAADEIHPYFFDRLQELPASCADGPTEETDDPVVNFEVFWNILNEQFAFFDLYGINWQQQFDDNLARVEQIRDGGEGNLEDVFADMIEQFRGDIHTGFSFPDPDDPEDTIDISGGDIPTPVDERVRAEFDQTFPEETLREDFAEDPEGFDDFEEYVEFRFDEFFDEIDDEFVEIIERYIGGPQESAAADEIFWGVIASDNVGYLSIDSMEGFSEDDTDAEEDLEILEEVLDEVMADLNDTDALIIDLRFNGGGFDSVSLAIAARFFDEERLAFRKKARKGDDFGNRVDITVAPSVEDPYTKPIFLLISGDTFSAAEVFALAMRNLPYVTIVGEPSGCCFSDSYELSLPNGWSVNMSNEVYEAPDGSVFEKTGLPPEIPALMYDPSFRANKLDAAIEAVLQAL